MSVNIDRGRRGPTKLRTGLYAVLAIGLIIAGVVIGRATLESESDRQLTGKLDFWATGQYGCIHGGGDPVCGAIVLPDESEFEDFEGKEVIATVGRLRREFEDFRVIWVHRAK